MGRSLRIPSWEWDPAKAEKLTQESNAEGAGGGGKEKHVCYGHGEGNDQ